MEELAEDIDRFSEGAMPNAVAEMMARTGGFNIPADFLEGLGMSKLAAAPRPMPFADRGRMSVAGCC